MFHELVESAAVRKQTKQGFAAIASALVQSVGLLVLLLLPLIYTQALPRTVMSAFLIAPPSVTQPHPAQQTTQTVRTRRLPTSGVFRQPTGIPPTIVMIQEPPLPPDSPFDSQISEAPGLDLLSSAVNVSGPPRPLPPATPAKQRIQLGGLLVAAKLTSQSNPVYPALALQARIQGDVVLHAIIDREGRVSELQVVSGSPLLAKAALDAVRTWRYQPTLLNNEPVEVDTTITVSFVLGGR